MSLVEHGDLDEDHGAAAAGVGLQVVVVVQHALPVTGDAAAPAPAPPAPRRSQSPVTTAAMYRRSRKSISDMAAQMYTASCSVGTTTDHRTACQAARTNDGGVAAPSPPPSLPMACP
jgi:hypothetical protein